MNYKNKKAWYDFEIIEKYEAGLVLCGSEVKSLRKGAASIKESYCVVDKNNEVYLRNSTIQPYSKHYSNEPIQDRKLLLKKKEILKLKKAISEKGLTIVPLEVFVNDRGIFKILIALARGKKNYDKRKALKEKDLKRELSRF